MVNLMDSNVGHTELDGWYEYVSRVPVHNIWGGKYFSFENAN